MIMREKNEIMSLEIPPKYRALLLRKFNPFETRSKWILFQLFTVSEVQRKSFVDGIVLYV